MLTVWVVVLCGLLAIFYAIWATRSVLAADQGNARMQEIGASADAAWNTGALEALKEAVAGQARQSGVRWVDALSSSVRPILTFWFMALYCAAKTALFVASLRAGLDWTAAATLSWTPADQALWAGVLNFWFLGRVFDRVRP